MIDSETAQAWQEREEYVLRGGAVVVVDGVGQGWMNQLHNPECWRPGCVVVAEHGAASWMPR